MDKPRAYTNTHTHTYTHTHTLVMAVHLQDYMSC